MAILYPEFPGGLAGPFVTPKSAAEDSVLTTALKARFPDKSSRAVFQSFVDRLGGKRLTSLEMTNLPVDEQSCAIVEASSLCYGESVSVRIKVSTGSVTVISAQREGSAC